MQPESARSASCMLPTSALETLTVPVTTEMSTVGATTVGMGGVTINMGVGVGVSSWTIVVGGVEISVADGSGVGSSAVGAVGVGVLVTVGGIGGMGGVVAITGVGARVGVLADICVGIPVACIVGALTGEAVGCAVGDAAIGETLTIGDGFAGVGVRVVTLPDCRAVTPVTLPGATEGVTPPLPGGQEWPWPLGCELVGVALLIPLPDGTEAVGASALTMFLALPPCREKGAMKLPIIVRSRDMLIQMSRQAQSTCRLFLRYMRFHNAMMVSIIVFFDPFPL
jgi:hypothetical protein